MSSPSFDLFGSELFDSAIFLIRQDEGKQLKCANDYKFKVELSSGFCRRVLLLQYEIMFRPPVHDPFQISEDDDHHSTAETRFT